MKHVNTKKKRTRIKENGFHYVVNEALEHLHPFARKKERLLFLNMLCQAMDRYHAIIHEYLLYQNHYHLIIEIREENLPQIMGYINACYTRLYNRHIGRTGHLWKERYRSYYINDSRCVEKLVMALEDYPVRQGITQRRGEYPGTMLYRIVEGLGILCGAESCLQEHDLLSRLLQNSKKAQELSELQEILKKEKDRLQRSKIRSYKKVMLESFLEGVRGREKRNRAIYDAYLHGFTLTEIADYLGLTISSISKIVKKYKGYHQHTQQVQNYPHSFPHLFERVHRAEDPS